MNQEREYLLQWLNKAEHDLIAAKLILDHQPIILDISCFHCQQAIEKFLKTFLIFHGEDFIKTHSLDILLTSCIEIDEQFAKVDVKNLEDFAVRGRYPHDFLLPTLEEAEDFYKIALEVRQLVLEKTGNT